MNKRSIIIFACFMTLGSMQAQEEAPTQQLMPSTPTETSVKPKPEPTMLSSFSQFVRIFMALLRNQQIKNNLQMIENLFASLLETAHQVIQTTKPTELQKTRSDQVQADAALIAQLAHTIIVQSESLSINRVNKPHRDYAQEDKQQTQEILGSFAVVVQNFFNILRDPENPETVPASIMGMVAGMVNIGTIVMTKGNLDLNADHEQLKAYAAELDTELKKDMYRIIFTTQERCGITLN